MIYLDSAATSFLKPAAVSQAMEEALRSMSSPGRGGYSEAMRAANTLFECRSELAELFGAENPENVVFTMNATHALNIAIKSLVPPGGRVVTSGYEHNAVTRPLAAIKGVQTVVAAGPLFQPNMVVQAFDRCITPETSAVVCNHVSNVFGFVQPVEAVGKLCRERGVPYIIDASQSAGMLSLDIKALGAAFIAMPGHKGLYGPQGTGVLICGGGSCIPLMEGGTGSVSIQQEMPDFLPDRLEAGTHNMPGIAGLLEGVRFVRRNSPEQICQHERRLALQASEGLRRIPGVMVCGRRDLYAQTGVLSFLPPENMDVEEIGNELSARDIAVRTGIHCAPLAHTTAGTLDTGTVRVSFSYFNTEDEVDTFLNVVDQILSKKRG